MSKTYSSKDISREVNKDFVKRSDKIVVGESEYEYVLALLIEDKVDKDDFSPADIFNALKELGKKNVSKHAVYKALDRLKDRGILGSPRWGRYTLLVDVQELLQNIVVKRRPRFDYDEDATKAEGIPVRTPLTPLASRTAPQPRGQAQGVADSGGEGGGVNKRGASKDPAGTVDGGDDGSTVKLTFKLGLGKLLSKLFKTAEVTVEGAVEGGSPSTGSGFEIMFDNVRGEGYTGKELPWRSKEHGGTRLSWGALALYKRIWYTEVDFVDKDPEYTPLFYTKVYFDKRRKWLVVEMLPPKKFVKRHGVSATVRMATHELVTLTLLLVKRLLNTVHGRLRRRFVESLMRILRVEPRGLLL